mmetsp:Transcript_7828/g.23015  ORF Transcript_7828/g.23015 Transcript_7828/m.23015 type:complete len:377 (+) Transcript_7828:114-1244(+)
MLANHRPRFVSLALGLLDAPIQNRFVGLQALVGALQEGNLAPNLGPPLLQGGQPLCDLFPLVPQDRDQVSGLGGLRRGALALGLVQAFLVKGSLLLQLALQEGVVPLGRALQFPVHDLSLLGVRQPRRQAALGHRLRSKRRVAGIRHLDQFSVLLVLNQPVDVSLPAKIVHVLGFRVERIGVEGLAVVLPGVAAGEKPLRRRRGRRAGGGGGLGRRCHRRSLGRNGNPARDDTANQADVVVLRPPAHVAPAQGFVQARVIVPAHRAGSRALLQTLQVKRVVADGGQQRGMRRGRGTDRVALMVDRAGLVVQSQILQAHGAVLVARDFRHAGHRSLQNGRTNFGVWIFPFVVGGSRNGTLPKIGRQQVCIRSSLRGG